MEKELPYVVKTLGNTKLIPKLINIDGSEDPFYRYKMRQLFVQVVGKGKMIKTVLLNVDDVAKDLKVHPSHLTAYLGYEIGAQYKYEPKNSVRERASISGDLDAKDLSSMMKKFIQEFILCPRCKLPEVTLFVDEKAKVISITCRSCGEKTILKNLKLKFAQYILNHPFEPITTKEEKVVKKKQKEATTEVKTEIKTESSSGLINEEIVVDLSISPASQGEVEKKKKKSKDEEDDGVEWSCSTSVEAVKQRRQSAIPESVNTILSATPQVKSDPLSQFKSFIENNPKGNIAAEVKRIQREFGLSTSKRAPLLFEVLFEPDIVPNVHQYKNVFLELITDVPAKMSLLDCIEKLSYPKLIKKAPRILKDFYDDEILDEDSILSWYDTKLSNSDVKKELEPLIQWLREAEEESD